MKKKYTILKAITLLLLITKLSLYGQNVGIGTNNPDPSSKLEIRSNNSGLLIPRMSTSERNAISNPSHSLLIFNTDNNCFEFYNSVTNAWVALGCGCTLPNAPTASPAVGITMTSFTANWVGVSGITCYQLDVATDPSFNSILPGYNNISVGNVTSYNITGLSCGTTYYYRIRSCNSCGNSASSNVIAVATSNCCTSFPNTVVFNYTGSYQDWTVPAGVTCISVDVRGASGGDRNGSYAMPGGLGARVTGVISVTPGDVLRIYVGGKGQNTDNSSSGGAAGGFNGGGNGNNGINSWHGAGGGGASDIRVAPYGLNERIVVAGGGGGGAIACSGSPSGGHGGCINGATATDETSCQPWAGMPGSGGTQISGGLGGNAGNSQSTPGTNGAFGVGGMGGSSTWDSGGGGGGGGYYGGGGGGGGYWSSGGGGGSSLVPSTCTCTPAIHSGNGVVIIYY